jgi:hypothetical protein
MPSCRPPTKRTLLRTLRIAQRAAANSDSQCYCLQKGSTRNFHCRIILLDAFYRFDGENSWSFLPAW